MIREKREKIALRMVELRFGLRGARLTPLDDDEIMTKFGSSCGRAPVMVS